MEQIASLQFWKIHRAPQWLTSHGHISVQSLNKSTRIYIGVIILGAKYFIHQFLLI